MIRFLLIFILLFSQALCAEYTPELFSDNLVETTLQNVENEYPKANLNYDYNSIDYISIEIRFKEKISSKYNHEGEIFNFEVVKDVIDKDGKVLIHAGDCGKARLETVSERGGYGVPAQIILANFEITGFNKWNFDNIEKSGKNFSILALSLKNSICLALPGSSYLLLLMRGGNVTISPQKTYVIKYRK